MQVLIKCYVDLLMLPHGDSRTNLQPALAALRDEIARLSGHTAETIQNTFEVAAEVAQGGPNNKHGNS